MKTKLIIILIFFSIKIFAQQDSQYTEYMHNTININPAYAGSREVLSMYVLHRNQWVGLEGAPVTNTFSANMPIENSRFGIGASIINDKIGPILSNSYSADASFTVDLNYFYRLSFGLKVNVNTFTLNSEKLNPFDPYTFQVRNINNYVTPNFGTGLFLHSDNSYLGLSARNLLQPLNRKDIATYKEKTNVYLIGGHVFDVNRDLLLKPAFLIKGVEGAPLQIDLSGNFLIKEKLTLGLAYRVSASVSALAGLQFNKNFYLGYAYDFETTQLGYYNSGSHEVFIRYELTKGLPRYAKPKFF